MKKIILLLTVCYLKLVYCDERRDLNNLFSLPDFNHSLNVATGEWIESSTDYETAGPHPLVLKRLFCPSISHSDSLTPEWKFSLPHFSFGGIPILEWQGYHFAYNEKRELIKATNRYGQSVKIERPDPSKIELILSNNQKIHYQFEKIGNHPFLTRVKRPGMSDRIYSYRKNGKKVLLQKRDETEGRFLAWEHDSEGRIIKTLAPAGTTSEPYSLNSISYSANKTEVENPYGYKKVYTYNDDKQVTKIEHFLEHLVKSEEFGWRLDQMLYHKIYGPEGELLAARYLDYDEMGRLVKETWEGSITGLGKDKTSRTLSYDKDNHLILEQEEEKTTCYRWDRDLLVYKKEGSIETYFAYNDQGLPIEERIQEGDNVRLSQIGPYTNYGLPEKVSNFLNGVLIETKSFTYSKEGWVLTETVENESGFTSKVYERDLAGRVLSSVNEKGDVETFEYDLHGNIVKYSNVHETKVLQYDYMNRLISENGRSAYKYDLNGNTLSKSDEHGNTTHFTYDGMGRIVKITYPIVKTLNGAEAPVTTYEYDAFDRIIKKTEPRGDVTLTQYNLRGQPIEIIYPDQTRENFEYTKLGLLKKKKLRDQREQLFEYDFNGRLIHLTELFKNNIIQDKEFTYSLDQVIKEKTASVEATPGYSSKGKLDSVAIQGSKEIFFLEAPKDSHTIPPPQEIDFKIESLERLNELGQWVLETTYTTESGIKVVKVYDALNRVVLIEKYDPMGNLSIKKERIYDLNGDLVKETFQGVTNSYIRKPGGKITELIEAEGTPCQRKTSFIYDEYDNLKTIIKPDGIELQFTYDRDHLIELKSSDNSVHYLFQYDDEKLTRLKDCLTEQCASREYNALGLVTKEVFLNGLKIEYGYDEKGRPVELKLPDDTFITYQYVEDKLYQVSKADRFGNEKYSHRFLTNEQEEMILGLGTIETLKDIYGRTLSITSPYRKEEYEFESDLNSVKINGIVTRQFAYDSFHRLIQDNEDTFEYDERDNLKSFSYDELNRITSDGYRYDLNGNMIENPNFTFKYDALNRLIEVKSRDATIKYSYDPFNRRMSRNQTRFFWDGLEEIGSFDQGISDLKIMAKGKIIACEIDNVPYAVQSDFKNTPVLYINSEKQLASGPYALQGKRKDPTTGFIYFGARDYDPEMRRFISCDPKGYADGFNLYHYARNNPNRFNDYFGHTSISDIAKEPFSYGWHALKTIYRSLNSFRDWINSFSGLGAAYKYLQESVEVLLGKGFIAFAGGYSQEGQTGIFGNGEISDKVRVTFIHGILNIRADLIDNLRQLSQAHGGINIHYLFRPTQGFAWDILKCISIKFGYVSTESRELVRIWKSLIEEMGGINGGGRIIHYAHSLGGTDTFTALSYLTPEEQKMIDIRTLGSATLIPQEGHYNVVNYVSVRDGVSYFDPLRYIQAIYSESNIVFIGTFLGFPFKDHPLSVDSYQGIIKALGQAFLETYG